ncbi:MAG: AarF/ABC1/UbiB kinase family protein [Candidatus Sumerlaeia bacterium]|nr:AarF/ABC1/UbiB kinase family protein [Candidatus Sumerlaeia bacterium]
MKLQFTIRRSIRVFLALAPFIISFLRDWKSSLFFGGPRTLTAPEHLERATRLRNCFSNLGPSFIKAAQVLAQREDIIPEVYCREFRKLQDQVPPFPSRAAARIFRDSLGKSPNKIFDEFDPDPIAAASLGQVHRAVFKGRPVAVKILRPGVEELVSTDLRVVRFLLVLAEAFIDENLMGSFRAVLHEYERMMGQEMDFRNELKNAGRLRHNLRNNPRVYVPLFVPALTTRKTAVIEYIEGVRVDDVEGLRRLDVSTEDLTQLLIETWVRMVVVDGFIHADPHPGNLLVDKQKRLVLLDFGMALEFSERTRLELLKLVHAVTTNDIDSIVDGFYTLDMVDPGINRGVLRDAAQTLLEIQLTTDVTPRQIQEIAQDIIDTFYKFPLRMPTNLVYLFRASSLIEGIAMQYNPRFNALQAATPIIREMLREIAFSGDKPMKDRIIDGAKEFYTTTRELAEVIHRMEREQLRIRIHEADIFALERFFNILYRRLVSGGALGVLAIAVTFIGLQTGSVFALVLALLAIMVLFILLALVPIPRTGGGDGTGPYFK